MSHSWEYNAVTNIKTSFSAKQGDYAAHFDIARSFLKNQIQARLKLTINKNGQVMPSIHFSST
jgi:hypothetical protein